MNVPADGSETRLPASRRRPAAAERERRVRDPESTREAILAAARTVLSQDGQNGLSVAAVAQLAGINRGTAYQHFSTREQLIEATAAWVSDTLRRSVFGDAEDAAGITVESISAEHVAERLVEFAMENPELGKVWLFELLSSGRPASDPFWRQYHANMASFARTNHAAAGIDPEVLSVLTLSAIFLWPVWARSHTRSVQERKDLAKRFSQELLRLCMHGAISPQKWPQLLRLVRGEG